MKTFLGTEIPPEIRGILYLCHYDHKVNTITVGREMLFTRAFDALEAYANIRNPESQMAGGGTKEEFEKDLESLHTNLNDPEWVKELADYL